MQDRDHSCLGAQVFGIRGDVADGLSGRLEKDVIDDRLVLETDRRDRRGHGEDDMEIGNGQQLRLAVGDPVASRTAPPPHLTPAEIGERQKKVASLLPKYRTEMVTT